MQPNVPIVGVAESGQRSADRQIRWVPIKNTTEETMPGFAVGSIRADEDELNRQGELITSNEMIDGQTVWKVKKPSSLEEISQNPSILIFNSGTPIPAKGIGRGTFDLPARALHDGRNDTGLGNVGLAVGPRANSWYLWAMATAGAFINLGHDTTYPLSGGRQPVFSDTVHTIWVAARKSQSGLAASRYGGALVNVGSVIVPTNPIVTPSIFSNLVSYNSNTGTFTALVDATWWISISGTVSSTADEGTVLRMTLQNDGVDTPYTGHRLQSVFRDLDYYNDIGADPYTTEDDALTPSPYNDIEPFYSAENIAFGGPLQVSAGNTIRVVNKSLVPILVGDFLFSLFLIAQ